MAFDDLTATIGLPEFAPTLRLLYPMSLLAALPARWRPAGVSLRRWGGQVRAAGLNMLFPPRCACCDGELPTGETLVPLCGRCSTELAPEVRPACGRCGAPVAAAQAGCPNCEGCRGRPMRFARAVALGNYDGLLRTSVLRMKRDTEEPLSAALAELFFQRREAALAALVADVVVPAPMYWLRRLARGTNSPEIVAERLARRLRLPCVPRMIRRLRNTRPQGALARQERLENVRGAFRLRRGCDVRGAKVLLVDDILTTGATCGEIARQLLTAGAKEVSVAVLARAHGPLPK